MYKETLDHKQLAVIFEKVKKLPERPQWLSSKARPVSAAGTAAMPAKKVTRATKAPAKRAPAKKAPAKKAAVQAPPAKGSGG